MVARATEKQTYVRNLCTSAIKPLGELAFDPQRGARRTMPCPENNCSMLIQPIRTPIPSSPSPAMPASCLVVQPCPRPETCPAPDSGAPSASHSPRPIPLLPAQPPPRSAWCTRHRAPYPGEARLPPADRPHTQCRAPSIPLISSQARRLVIDAAYHDRPGKLSRGISTGAFPGHGASAVGLATHLRT